MPSPTYSAELRNLPDHGLQLQPSAASVVPDQPEDLNLLALAVAIALGRAGYEHHPEPRDPEIQTFDALLRGETTAPWRPETGVDDQPTHIRCEQLPTRVWTCTVDRSA